MRKTTANSIDSGLITIGFPSQYPIKVRKSSLHFPELLCPQKKAALKIERPQLQQFTPSSASEGCISK